MARLFGTDGVRGIANLELTPELAFRIGRAGAYALGAECGSASHPVIVVGRDTRVSGDMLQQALCAGILSAGAEAIDLGVATTPAVAWLARNLPVQAGVVISASHNPVQDNGIKFFSHQGYKLSDDLENEIEALIPWEPLSSERPVGAAVGRLHRDPALISKYLDYLSSLDGLSLEGLRIAIDCANGASSHLALPLYEKMGAQVFIIHNQPNGVNINDGCGSTHPESLQRFVMENSLDLGLCFDGDADRCLATDAKGNMLDGDQIMVILALAMQEQGKLPGDTVVATVMSNLGFHQALSRHGIKVFTTKVGDRYVLEAMKEHGYGLGGEQAGHIIVSELASTGDGLLSGLLLANRVRQTGSTLEELAATMTLLPQVLINTRVADKEGVMMDPAFIEAIKLAETELSDRGRILIRPSGTEALLRVMVEATKEEEARGVAEKLAGEAQRLSPFSATK
ncbi:MAG: phosphoglucosamine mutase [Symbiobacteriaceae bacterium]|nr:phosphoglucosamine mutase [Symbiobacteriaceae bacterium]